MANDRYSDLAHEATLEVARLRSKMERGYCKYLSLIERCRLDDERDADALALWLLALVILFNPASPSWAQAETDPLPSPQSDTLADSLLNSNGKEIHIFYIHGIGSDGPNDYDSQLLRESLCEYLKDCTTPAGAEIGPSDYADQDEFEPNAPISGYHIRVTTMLTI